MSMNVNCDSNAWLGTIKLGTYSWLSNKHDKNSQLLFSQTLYSFQANFIFPLTPTEIMKKICSVIHLFRPPIDENNSAVKGATYFLNDPKPSMILEQVSNYHAMCISLFGSGLLIKLHIRARHCLPNTYA